MGQLQKERLTPAPVFSKVGVDYAGPLLLKTGYTRKHVLKKAYVCAFVCMAFKVVHLELVAELTIEAFIATFCCFVARRGCPTNVFRDHGTNFFGADRQLAELQGILQQSKVQDAIATSGVMQGIQWHFIPEQTPNFGGVWEAVVRSFKGCLRKVAGDLRLTYEELCTILNQIEACLNSRPLVPMTTADGEGVEAFDSWPFPYWQATLLCSRSILIFLLS